MDPMNEYNALNEAKQMIAVADENQNHHLELEEILKYSEYFTGSKLMDYARNVHEEFWPCSPPQGSEALSCFQKKQQKKSNSQTDRKLLCCYLCHMPTVCCPRLKKPSVHTQDLRLCCLRYEGKKNGP